MAKRIAIVDRKKCINGKGCSFVCGGVCPVNRTGKECIVEVDGKPVINEEVCIGCGICPKRCPVHCISIINLPEKLADQPIHRHGVNGFELFSLPTPIFGKVVGVIGRNGIGKSTAIQILAGILKPNLGDYTSKGVGFDKLIDFFKGTEAQTFFEKINAGEIKVSFKPQSVDLLPKTTKGKVIDLLKKIDEKDMFDEIVEKLELKKFLQTDISKVSGGELQRVAIAATVLKKANLYIFDEPTSYLDIKQRIKVSKFIRQLADENTAVVVIEHDLIILDYIADLIHLMYGQAGCYGIVSQTKSVREGINIYLSGYLKEENMRFRDHEIKFEVSPPAKTVVQPEIVSWTDVKKKLGKFNLASEKGEINRKDVVGILGENGIGKTSFVKILAGVDKPDSGKITEKIKVSYKPQYIDTMSDEPVMVVLKDAIKKHNKQLIVPLEIDKLLDRKINELSGGELQRVAIALALSKEADLYLLDEPSAYLDVEQRLVVSRLIRDTMDLRGTSAMIVDHDLLFLDYLSKKLMVFEGEPAVSGNAKGPYEMEQGMNIFLKEIELSFRRDPQSNRPRANKIDSVKDREQKSSGKLYYG